MGLAARMLARWPVLWPLTESLSYSARDGRKEEFLRPKRRTVGLIERCATSISAFVRLAARRVLPKWERRYQPRGWLIRAHGGARRATAGSTCSEMIPSGKSRSISRRLVGFELTEP